MNFDFESFKARHIGPDAAETDEMLKVVGAPSLDALIDDPSSLRFHSIGEIVDELDVITG